MYYGDSEARALNVGFDDAVYFERINVEFETAKLPDLIYDKFVNAAEYELHHDELNYSDEVYYKFNELTPNDNYHLVGRLSESCIDEILGAACKYGIEYRATT